MVRWRRTSGTSRTAGGEGAAAPQLCETLPTAPKAKPRACHICQIWLTRMGTRAHTHTRTRTRATIRPRAYTFPCASTCTHTCGRASAPTRARTHKRVSMHTRVVHILTLLTLYFSACRLRRHAHNVGRILANCLFIFSAFSIHSVCKLNCLLGFFLCRLTLTDFGGPWRALADSGGL